MPDLDVEETASDHEKQESFVTTTPVTTSKLQRWTQWLVTWGVEMRGKFY